MLIVLSIACDSIQSLPFATYQAILPAVKPAMRSSSRCAIVPALDCQHTVAAVVQGIRRLQIPAVVIDDGSRDDTAAVAEEAGATVLRHSENRGKGHALVTGFRWALEHDVQHVLTLDGDGQHDPAEIPALLEQASADMVVGRRCISPRAMPLSSLIGNTTSMFWVSLFTGRFCPDAQCGFRVYSAQLLRRVPLVGGRFETETEILLRAALLGLTIRWVPIRTIYPPRGQRTTHFRTRRDPLRVIAVTIRSVTYPRSGR
jgi:glycosyltransferase involved in cell wall biosynthesis